LNGARHAPLAYHGLKKLRLYIAPRGAKQPTWNLRKRDMGTLHGRQHGGLIFEFGDTSQPTLTRTSAAVPASR